MKNIFPLKSYKFWMLLSAATIIGFLLGKIDSSPHWDDTGIMVVAILISSFLLGLIMPKYAWLWALIIGGFITGFDLILQHNTGAAVSIIFALAGSYIGVLFRKNMGHTK